MCRGFLIAGRGAKFSILMNYTVNSYNAGNTEGFFLSIGKNKSIRTLDFNEFLQYIRDNRCAINSAKIVCGHLRLATNPVSDDNVHGWKMKGYYCYHNGINKIVNKKNDNDSYDFFERVFHHKKIRKGLLQELKERGSGCYFMVNPEKEIIMLASATHGFTMHLINHKLLVVNSGDDIHKFNEAGVIERNCWYRAFGMAFSESEKEKIDIPDVRIYSDIDEEIDDQLVTIVRVEDEYHADFYELPKKIHGYGGYKTYEYDPAEHLEEEENIEAYNKRIRGGIY